MAAANTVAISAVEPGLLIALHSVERLELAVIGDLYICGDGTSDARSHDSSTLITRNHFIVAFARCLIALLFEQVLRKMPMEIRRRSASPIAECTVGHVTW